MVGQEVIQDQDGWQLKIHQEVACCCEELNRPLENHGSALDSPSPESKRPRSYSPGPLHFPLRAVFMSLPCVTRSDHHRCLKKPWLVIGMWAGPERLLHPVLQTGTHGGFRIFTLVMSQGRKHVVTLQGMTEENVMKGRFVEVWVGWQSHKEQGLPLMLTPVGGQSALALLFCCPVGRGGSPTFSLLRWGNSAAGPVSQSS